MRIVQENLRYTYWLLPYVTRAQFEQGEKKIKKKKKKKKKQVPWTSPWILNNFIDRD